VGEVEERRERGGKRAQGRAVVKVPVTLNPSVVAHMGGA